jgi:RHS repeat-associated protein
MIRPVRSSGARRFVTGLAALSQVCLLIPMTGWSQEGPKPKWKAEGALPLPDAFKEDWVPPAAVLTPREIMLNRAADVQAPSFELPADGKLSDQDLKQAKVFGIPFRSTRGREPGEPERDGLGKLLRKHAGRKGEAASDAEGIKEFVKSHPESGYNTSLLIEAGDLEWRHGHFLRSLETLQKAWDLSKDFTEPDDRRLAEMALGQLLRQRSLLGQKDALQRLIDEVKDRPLGGYAADALVRAKEVMWFLNHKAERNIFCGFTATNAICVPRGERPIFPDVHNEEEKEIFIRDGLSAFELKAHSHEADGSLKIIKRVSGKEIVVPSVVHFHFGHYSAITEKSPEGLYRVTDEHLRYDSWVRPETLEEQMSGYFLVPEGVKLPTGYVEVQDEEAKGVFGRHCVHARDDEGCQNKGGGNGSKCPTAMATYSFNLMNPGLFVTDTPIQHKPPYGPAVMFEVNYDQRSTVISDLQTLGNLGPRWSHSFAEAISLTGTGTPNTQVKWVQGDGTYFRYNYNTTSGSYSQGYKERPQLTYLTSGQGGPGYQLTFSDGSKKLFTKPNAATPTKYLLTQLVDSLGNTLTLAYDANLRLTTITDALGQPTTLSYATEAGDNVTSDTFKIRKVTDPFSRVAKFKYTTTGQLEKIIDPVGITSEFKYTTGDFIERLTTPYGPMEFTQGQVAGINNETGRFIESKDAQGYRERVEANDLALPENYVANPAAPTSVSVNGTNVPFLPKNDNLFFRNTFYWDRQQMYWWPGDYSKCRIYNWLTSTVDTITSVLGSIKDPLEGRVWFNYPGQASSHSVGNVGSPSKVVRAVENSAGATTWTMSQSSFNDLGLPTGSVDPEGRELKYEYHTNNRDVQYVRVKNGAAWETLATISQYYTVGGVSTGLPEIATDASGLQTQTTYNVKGQVAQVVRSKGGNSETTRIIYDSNLDGTPDAFGYPIRVEKTAPGNPTQFVTLQSFTYDAAKRIRTSTDEQGLILTYDYDTLDRVTLVTYPDATTEQIVYTDGTKQTHDVWAMKDRAGRWTRMRYSQHRQLLMQLDPAMRLTQYAWCLCGQMRQLTDPEGKVTSWKRDAQGRVTEKLLPDGKKYLYTFQPLSGRPATTAFPKDVLNNQVTMSYAYHLGGDLQKVDYTDAAMADVTYALPDFLGRPTTVADGIGTTAFSYRALTAGTDGAGRLFSANGPLADDTLRFSYDWQSRPVKSELVKDDGVTVSRSEEITLDTLGRINQLVNNLGTFTSTYAAGNLTGLPDSVSLPGGFGSQFTRFPANAGADALRLKTIHHQQGATTVQKHDYTYDLAGNLVSWTRTPGAGSATAWALRHDPADQLSELEETLGGVSQKKESWHYDRAGNLASTVNTPAGQTGVLQMRTHTGRNQLTQLGGTGKTLVEGTTDEAATVKVNGQPAQVTKLGPSGPWRFQKEMDFPSGTTSITVEAKDGANNVRTNTYNVNVAASGAQTLEYDANGNLLKVKDAGNVVLRSYEWDASNRLLAIQIPGAVAAGTKRTEFVYDGAGRRVRQLDKEHNGSAWATQSHWYYLWDGLELAQKRDVSTGNVLANYFANGEQQGANSLVYLSDHLGSPRSWYRVSDGAVGSADYSAYGVRTVTATGPGVPEGGYTGHLHHPASGLALAPYRAYDPALGRWISEDPIEEEGGVNLYGYVENDPIHAIDELGLQRGRPIRVGPGSRTGPIGSRNNPFVFPRGMGPSRNSQSTSPACRIHIWREAAQPISGNRGSGNTSLSMAEAMAMGRQWVGKNAVPMHNAYKGKNELVGFRDPSSGRTWRFPVHKPGAAAKGFAPTGMQMNLGQPCPNGGWSNYHVSVRPVFP